MAYQNRTEQRQHHFSVEPTLQEVDREMRDLSDAQIARLAEQADFSALGSRPWQNWTTQERRAIRAGNEQARRRHEAERVAEKAEQQRKLNAQHQARIDTQIAEYKQQMRRGFPGDDAQFEAAWPKMLQQWQISEAQRQASDLEADVRRRVGSAF